MITINNLTKQFGDFTAVDQLNIEIIPNEIFGLLGLNGAGKTTTINMLCGLLKPTSGTIHYPAINGRDQRTLIGYCPQENIFYPKLSCLEQLIFTARMYGVTGTDAKAQANKLLDLLGLKDKSNVYASKLSGGMKRRLNICLALIHNPEILILDEPEAGLDPQSRLLVREFIQFWGKQKTVILTTHNMDEADRLADRIGIMDHGKILALDTPANLKKSIGNAEALELELENETTALKLVQLITQKVEGAKITNAENKVFIQHQDSIPFLMQIQQLATANDIRIKEFRLRENTLEDVFIHLTGRNLRS